MADATPFSSSKSRTLTQDSGSEARVVLVQDNKVVPCELTAAEFLGSFPRGAYTTARSVNRHSIFEYDFHVARLASSIELMIKDDIAHGREASTTEADKLHPELTQAELLLPIVTQSVQTAIGEYQNRFPEDKGELKITILISWQTQDYSLATHVCPLPPRPRPPVRVQILGHPRDNAAAKDSEWVRQRKSLESAKSADVNEILLMSDNGDVLEGMTSNFFVVQGGKVVTAEEGVLLGTVRQVILSICAKKGIPVEQRAPNLSECNLWEGAFISSTSRLLLPIDQLLLPEPGPGPEAVQDKGNGRRNEIQFSHSLCHDLADAVIAEVAANSTRVMMP